MQQNPTLGNLDFDKIWSLFLETDARFKETEKEMKETDKQMKETDNRMKETDKRMKETDRRMKETDKQIKELGKQIGGLGNKFGSYNEGLFMPSLIKILQDTFKCRRHAPRYRFKDNGNFFEIDLLGLSEVACYIVEIKSHLKNEAIDQLKNTICKFKKYDELANNKKIYGIICATDYDDDTSNYVFDNGIYFISTMDDIARLKKPKGFKPVEW